MCAFVCVALCVYVCVHTLLCKYYRTHSHTLSRTRGYTGRQAICIMLIAYFSLGIAFDYQTVIIIIIVHNYYDYNYYSYTGVGVAVSVAVNA